MLVRDSYVKLLIARNLMVNFQLIWSKQLQYSKIDS